MIFAKIDFINLLPFYTYIKKELKSSQAKAIINYKKSYPSIINKQFKKRQIDCAFISSVVSKKYKCLDIGIVAKKEVLSVLAFGDEYKKDIQSDTSNALCKILGIKSEVLIGDKALHYYYNSKNREFLDLAKVWNDKYNLPFVFARLCCNKNHKIINKLANEFVNKKIKIPQYILNKYSKRSGLTNKQILYYLEKISYKIGNKEKKSLKLFFKEEKKLLFNGDHDWT